VTTAPSPADYIEPRRITGRVIASFLVVTFFSVAQVLLIYLGWGTAIDLACTVYPAHPAWLEASFLRVMGLIFGLLCVLYPVYFGMFRLGFHVQPLLDSKMRSNSTP
jgi:hypothetical protein